jgi:hypothetical protein
MNEKIFSGRIKRIIDINSLISMILPYIILILILKIKISNDHLLG